MRSLNPMTTGASRAGGGHWQEVDEAECARHAITAAVAQRTALTEATILLDAHATRIAKQHPGRRRDTLSVEGQKLYDAVKACADMIDSLRGVIDVPEKVGPLYVPNMFRREILEAEVERQVPGTYPRRLSALTTSEPAHD